MKPLGVSTGHAVAMANKNFIYKDGADDPREALEKDEQEIKKGAEAGSKRHEEQLTKISIEERTKKIHLQQKKVKAEERNKAFDDDLKTADEQATKKAKEQETKANEQSVKKIEEAESKRQSAVESAKRGEMLQKAQMNAAIDSAKTKAEVERKKAEEDIGKTNAEHEAKMGETKQKNELEAAQKNRVEQHAKSEAEAEQKKQAEAQSKAAKRAAEEADKRALAAAAEAEKQRKNNAEGKWCHCTSSRVYFERNNQWNLCPSGTLFVGFYRGGDQHINSLEYYRCCRPCREDGNTVLGVSGCVTGDWGISFDREGWSQCPGNTFITGYYKSSCNFIYCIEHAQCCQIESSRGRKDCGAKGSWGLSMDAAGWSVLDENRFAVGLYRSGGQYLYNIEYPNQCTFFSYTQQ